MTRSASSRIPTASRPTRLCGRAVGRLSPDGGTATVRSPDPSPVCARGAIIEWFGDDWRRFTRDCRLPSGEAFADLFEIRESDDLN